MSDETTYYEGSHLIGTPAQWYQLNRRLGYNDGLLGLYRPESTAQAAYGYDDGHDDAWRELKAATE